MRLKRTLALMKVALCPWIAHACTVCDSPTGKHLRAGLFDGHFGHTLLLVAAPVPVLVAAILVLHLMMPEFPDDLAQPPVKAGSIPEAHATELLA